MISYEQNGYSAGHPWYFYLGGRRLSLKQIRDAVLENGCEGWMTGYILDADKKSEPQRSETLRTMRAKVIDDLRYDIGGYRRCARELAARRKAGLDRIKQVACAEVHTNISLKFSHLVNDFAHLRMIDDLLSKQLDLFAA